MFTTPHWARCCWESLSSGWMGFTIAACGLLPLLKLPRTGWRLPAPLQARACRRSATIPSASPHAPPQPAFSRVKLRRERQLCGFLGGFNEVRRHRRQLFPTQRGRICTCVCKHAPMRTCRKLFLSSTRSGTLYFHLFLTERCVYTEVFASHPGCKQAYRLGDRLFREKIPSALRWFLPDSFKQTVELKIYINKNKSIRLGLSSSVVRSPQRTKLKSTAKCSSV